MLARLTRGRRKSPWTRPRPGGGQARAPSGRRGRPGRRLFGGTTLAWRDDRQIPSLVRWSDEVTPEVVAGRRLSAGLIISAMRAAWTDQQNERDDRRARQERRRAAPQSQLVASTDTEGLGLYDENGVPYTVAALLAADQAGRATRAAGETSSPFWARTILGLTQISELRRIQDQADQGTNRRTLLRDTGDRRDGDGRGHRDRWGDVLVAAAAPAAAYVAFSVRGVLGLHRGGYSQQMRVMVESILERGQFNVHTVRRLIETMRKYAIFDRATQAQIDRFDTIANDFLVTAHVLERYLLQSGEPAGIRNQTALEQFSIFLDKAGNALGAQAQSSTG